MRELRASRLRGGGYQWSLLRDAASQEIFVESWFEPSWTDHMRHHAHMTKADRQLQDKVIAFHKGKDRPPVTHWLAQKKVNPIKDA